MASGDGEGTVNLQNFSLFLSFPTFEATIILLSPPPPFNSISLTYGGSHYTTTVVFSGLNCGREEKNVLSADEGRETLAITLQTWPNNIPCLSGLLNWDGRRRR